jgi:hypothetical protein
MGRDDAHVHHVERRVFTGFARSIVQIREHETRAIGEATAFAERASVPERSLSKVETHDMFGTIRGCARSRCGDASRRLQTEYTNKLCRASKRGTPGTNWS